MSRTRPARTVWVGPDAPMTPLEGDVWVREAAPEPQPAAPDRAAKGYPTADAIRAERERRKAAGQLYGRKALANHFVVSPATIARRLARN